MGRGRQAFLVAVPVLLVAIVHCDDSTSGPDAGSIEEAGADASEGGAFEGGAETSSDTCPAQFPRDGSPCTTEGKRCSYCTTQGGSGGMLGTYCNAEICMGGTWQPVPHVCPCGFDPPSTGSRCEGNDLGCRCAYGGCGSSRRTFFCQPPGIPPAVWIEEMPAVPCNDAGM